MQEYCQVKNTHKIIWDFEIGKDQLNPAKRLDLVIVKRERERQTETERETEREHAG